MTTFYDTHAHLDFPDYQADLDQVLQRAESAGIRRIICIGTDLDSSRQAVQLADDHPPIHAVVGWHPNHVLEAPDDIRSDLLELAAHPKVVAIGETGLDFYRMPSQVPGGTAEDDRVFQEKQRQVFQQQLEVADQAGLNVVIHQRGDVLEETLSLLKPFSDRVRGQFHCFGGDRDVLKKILALNALVSFTGILTFKNAREVRDSLAACEPGQFMFETDCPFLAPVPFRGKRCEPAHVAEIARVASEVRGCTLESLSEDTCRTAHEFFPKLER